MFKICYEGCKYIEIHITYIVTLVKLVKFVLSLFSFLLHTPIDLTLTRGPGSSVGIATDYELFGPGSNPDGDEIFRPSRLVLGPTQPPVKWVPCLSRG